MRTSASALALLHLVLVLSACGRQPAVRASTGVAPTPASNGLLRDSFRQDQADQRGDSVATTSDERVQLVLSELANGRVVTPEDEFHAALVLDHTPLAIRDGRVVALSPYNYLLGHYLAKHSFEHGYARARTLVAQTLDRYLSFTQGYQKYGTSRIFNQQTGKEELPFVDRSTTDAERAVYGVPPLAETLKRFPELPRKKP